MIVVLVVVVDEVVVGVVLVVDLGFGRPPQAGGAPVEMRWRDPFGAAVFAFSGSPAAFGDQPVVAVRRLGPRRRCWSSPAGGPIGFGVVDLAAVAGHCAAGKGAAAVLGMQHDALPRRGGAPGATQIQRQLGVVVEDHQVVKRVAGHPDDVGHRQQGAATGDGLPGRSADPLPGAQRAAGDGFCDRREMALLSAGRRVDFLVQSELTSVEIEVLAGVTIDTLQRHVASL